MYRPAFCVQSSVENLKSFKEARVGRFRIPRRRLLHSLIAVGRKELKLSVELVVIPGVFSEFLKLYRVLVAGRIVEIRIQNTEEMSLFVDYRTVSRFYDNQRFPAGSDVMAAMIQFYTGKMLKDICILDAGCGTGNYAKSLLDIGVGQMALLDSSPEMIQRAKEKLGDYIANGKVTNVVTCTLPHIHFPTDSFDAVMFNLVLNHLDRDDPDFPNCVETLKESRRVLRPNGVIIISTILPTTVTEAVWFSKINKKYTKRFTETTCPSVDQFEKMLLDSGITCIQKMNILGSDLLKNYYNIDGPLEESLFRENAYFNFATESEVREIFLKLKELQDSGELENWMKENDHTDTIGLLTIFICKPISTM